MHINLTHSLTLQTIDIIYFFIISKMVYTSEEAKIFV